MSLELDQCRPENPTGNIEEVALLCTSLLDLVFISSSFFSSPKLRSLLSMDQKLMVVKWFIVNQIS